ncbi:MAG: DUF4369 domain-containing protein [Prevotella sp.]|nr:DUF4369 domain-containing protein [Candidatus Prevotella equi]
MKNIFLVIMAVLMTASCTKYDITGSTDLHDVDGRMMFLMSFTDGKLQNIDSCDVVHGKFKFSGPLDSVSVVMLSMNDATVLPVVLEDGKIEIIVNAQTQECKGTPLNDTLTIFNNRYRQLISQMQDLSHQQSQAIMNGEDMDIVNQRLAIKEQELIMQEDKLISAFIADNFDNCLGPYVFQMATGSYEYPMLTPWIEALMSKATDAFKKNAYVAEYMEMAKRNQDIMTGVVDAEPQLPQQPILPTEGPTPNELAQPAE